MSSHTSSDLVVAIQLAQTYICRFVGPVLSFIGIVGGVLNLIVFSQKTLRRSPCSIYFIAYNIVNILYICCALLYLIVSLGYNITPTLYNLVFCRLNLYTAILLHCLNQFYLILASIDRVLITSRNALTRRRSTHRLAYTCIIIGTIFWALFHGHTLIFATITQVAPNFYICYFRPGVEITFVAYYSLITETLVLLLMIICGLYSLNNIRGLRRIRNIVNAATGRTGAENNSHSTSSKDRQFVLMLILDIIIYTLFSCVLPIFLIYAQITQNDVKSTDRTQVENIIRNLCLFSITIPCCVTCYANLLVSKTFRKEVKKVLLCR